MPNNPPVAHPVKPGTGKQTKMGDDGDDAADDDDDDDAEMLMRMMR